MQTALLLSVLAPALCVALLLGLPLFLGVGARSRQVLTTVAAPLAAFAAYLPVRGLPELPPGDASVWALWMGWGTAALAALGYFGASVRRVGLAAAAALTAYLVAGPMLQRSSLGFSVMLVAGAAAASAALGLALESRARTLPGPALPLALSILCGGAAALLGTSGTALLAQAAGGVSVGFGVMFLLALLRPELDAAPAVGPLVVLVGGLLVGGACYAEVSALSVGALVVGALVVGVVPWPRRFQTPLFASLGLGLMSAAVSGAALGSSLVSSSEKSDSSSDEGGGYDGYGDDGYDGYDQEEGEGDDEYGY